MCRTSGPNWPDAVGWIRAAGGVAVIAHPGRYEIGRQLQKSWCRISKRWAARAIEVVSASHTLDQTHKFALLVARMELLASAGSDFHALAKAAATCGGSQDLPPVCVPVWSRFCPPRATPVAAN